MRFFADSQCPGITHWSLKAVVFADFRSLWYVYDLSTELVFIWIVRCNTSLYCDALVAFLAYFLPTIFQYTLVGEVIRLHKWLGMSQNRRYSSAGIRSLMHICVIDLRKEPLVGAWVEPLKILEVDYTLYVVLVVALVEHWTRDRKVADSTPGRGTIKSTRSTQPKSSTGLHGWG